MLCRGSVLAVVLVVVPAVAGRKNADDKATAGEDAVRLPEEGKATVKEGYRGSSRAPGSAPRVPPTTRRWAPTVVLDTKNPAPGADVGRKLHTFKATAPGDATLVITRVYRGKDGEKKTVVVHIE